MTFTQDGFELLENFIGEDLLRTLVAQIDMACWGPWTIKDGATHVQPPLEVLNQMVTFRIHLDDVHQDNGCLRVIPASHHQGLLTGQQINVITHNQPATACEAKAGTLLVMRPHLLHASSKSTSSERRRVIHLEYSSYQLPVGLSWA